MRRLSGPKEAVAVQVEGHKIESLPLCCFTLRSRARRLLRSRWVTSAPLLFFRMTVPPAQ